MSHRVRAHGQQEASYHTGGHMRGKDPKPESERDSGFSDASSEHFSALDQMDLDEAAQRTYPGAPASQLPMGGPYPRLSPMIFMNNTLVKQPNGSSPSPKPRGFQPAIEVLPQPQVVFLQPVVSADPSSQRGVSVKRRRSKKYRPILKSYPRIAPHPGDSSSDQGSSGSSDWSGSADRWRRRHRQKQRGCPPGLVLLTAPTLPVTPTLPVNPTLPVTPSIPVTPSPRAPQPKTFPLLQEHHGDSSSGVSGSEQLGALSDNQERTPSAAPADPSPLVQSPLVPSSSLVSPPAAPSPWPAEQADAPPDQDCDSKRQRFANTYNILRQSGLLDITMRVQELSQQNQRSQGQLERLQAQARLFLEAARSGSHEVWSRLQEAMLEAEP